MAKSEKSTEKKIKKEKKSKSEATNGTAATNGGAEGEVSKRNARDLVSVIAKPLADEKLSKKVRAHLASRPCLCCGAVCACQQHRVELPL
jgi:hypothetical protein